MKVSIGIIPLTMGYEALVDLADFDDLSAHLWSAKVTRRTGDSLPHVHAVRTVQTEDGPVQIYMHRVIMGADGSQMVDHANHNGLDNRRANLRFCTYADNNRNAVRQSRTGYRGVVRRPYGFYATIQVEGRRLHSKRCATPEEAALLYDQMARQHHGEFAVLNHPAGHSVSASNDNSQPITPQQPGPDVA